MSNLNATRRVLLSKRFKQSKHPRIAWQNTTFRAEVFEKMINSTHTSMYCNYAKTRYAEITFLCGLREMRFIASQYVSFVSIRESGIYNPSVIFPFGRYELNRFSSSRFFRNFFNDTPTSRTPNGLSGFLFNDLANRFC